MLVDIVQDFTVGDLRYTVGMNPNVDNEVAEQWIASGLARRVTDTRPSRRPVWVADTAPEVEQDDGQSVLVYDPSRPVGDSWVKVNVTELGGGSGVRWA